MPISDVWADWTTSPNTNTPAGSAIPEIDDEFRNVKAELKKNCVTLTGNQTIAGTKTFGSFPELSTATPTTDGQAVNKKYVDNLVSTSVANGLQSLLATGTKCFFCQASAPTGWTQDTTHNDRVLRVVSGSGAGTGGSWTFSGISVDGTQITQNQLPSHTHTINVIVPDYWGEAWTEQTEVVLQTTQITSQHNDISIYTGDTGSVGIGDVHGHGLSIGSSWRPAYVDIILATRN